MMKVLLLELKVRISYLTKCTSSYHFYNFKVISMELHFLYQFCKWFCCLTKKEKKIQL